MVVMAMPELMALTALASRRTEAMGYMDSMGKKVPRQLFTKVKSEKKLMFHG
jgi:hypothetical protein